MFDELRCLYSTVERNVKELSDSVTNCGVPVSSQSQRSEMFLADRLRMAQSLNAKLHDIMQVTLQNSVLDEALLCCSDLLVDSSQFLTQLLDNHVNYDQGCNENCSQETDAPADNKLVNNSPREQATFSMQPPKTLPPTRNQNRTPTLADVGLSEDTLFRLASMKLQLARTDTSTSGAHPSQFVDSSLQQPSSAAHNFVNRRAIISEECSDSATAVNKERPVFDPDSENKLPLSFKDDGRQTICSTDTTFCGVTNVFGNKLGRDVPQPPILSHYTQALLTTKKFGKESLDESVLHSSNAVNRTFSFGDEQ